MSMILPLLFLANAVAAPNAQGPKQQSISTVSVEIIRAEPIAVLNPPKGERPIDRQISRRGNVPTVDFY